MRTVPTPATAPQRQTLVHQPDSREVRRLRSAYRETVMAVEHYDDVYGEPLVAHAAAELSAEVATALQREGTPFTETCKSRLLAAVGRAIAQREEFCGQLAEERASITDGRETLTDLLDQLDRPSIPGWYTTEFEDELTDVAETRQETLRSRHPFGHVDDRDLCAFLYADRAWTFPLLTAVARLRGSVAYGTERGASAAAVESRD